jgi:hypothetical protein
VSCSDPSVVVVPVSLLRQLRVLCHPDRHLERTELATRLTAELNRALQRNDVEGAA